MRSGRGPRSSPAKTRAWQQRSREKAAENERKRAQARCRDQLKPGQIGFKEPPRPPNAKRRPEFRGPLLAGRSCFKCLKADRSVQARQWHHWTEQQHIRTYVDSLRIRDEAAERRLTLRLLNDPRNISPVCVGCHRRHTDSLRDCRAGVDHSFTADDVPDSARVFAAELGTEYVARLERTYL